MLSFQAYAAAFEDHLKKKIILKEPLNLYEPITYILNQGGKRLRPLLTLLITDVFGGDYRKALDAALAVEMFHNFSLVHDDIMDHAPLRRGKETVHEKWNINTGILSGDAMLIVAYQLFENYPPDQFRKLAKLFSKTAIEVCEGQQYDVDFETRDDVEVEDYIKMISFKTAVLLGAAMKMGALIAGKAEKEAELIYEFGLNLGIAFQLKDDYLDVYGDPETFGKQPGGDIIVNKKTFLYLKTQENLSPGDKQQLMHLYSIHPKDPSNKIETVRDFMTESGAAELTLREIQNYTHKSLECLEVLEISNDKKEMLRTFADGLMNREF